MIKHLTKSSKLHKTELRNLRILIDRAYSHDNFKIKAYWHILENRLTMEFNDLFYYLDGNLAGYLGLFVFEGNEPELTALVHPKYRQKHLFKKLLSEVYLELRQRGISHCLWICPQGSPINAEYLKRFQAEYAFSQVEMAAKRQPIEKDLPEVLLVPGTKADLSKLAKIGALSFNSSYVETLQRFTENFQEKNRKVWLVSTPDFDNIGKIHVRYDENRTAFIHDLCILPEYRGKKLATAMILKTMEIMRNEGQRNIVLDVECHNKGALRLYEQCGFDITSSYDFWRVPTDKVPF